MRYASVFDAIDQDQIQKLCLNQPVGNLRFEMLRWYRYTPSVFDDARERWQEAGGGASPLQSWTNAISTDGCPGF